MARLPLIRLMGRRALPVLPILGALLLAVTAASCGDDEARPLEITLGDEGVVINGERWPYQGAAMSREIAMPDASLQTAEGRTFDLRAETEGFVTLLYVGYTNCDDICPTHMAMIATALDELPPEVRARVKVIFITADPERDTPATLREWLDRFDKSFIGLTGDPDALVEVQDALGMNPAAVALPADDEDYELNHAAYVLAFPAGSPTALIAYPDGTLAQAYREDLQTLAAED